MNLYPYRVPYTKINSKLIVDLNVRTKAIKLIDENMTKHDLGLGNSFLDNDVQSTSDKE